MSIQFNSDSFKQLTNLYANAEHFELPNQEFLQLMQQISAENLPLNAREDTDLAFLENFKKLQSRIIAFKDSSQEVPTALVAGWLLNKGKDSVKELSHEVTRVVGLLEKKVISSVNEHLIILGTFKNEVEEEIEELEGKLGVQVSAFQDRCINLNEKLKEIEPKYTAAIEGEKEYSTQIDQLNEKIRKLQLKKEEISKTLDGLKFLDQEDLIVKTLDQGTELVENPSFTKEFQKLTKESMKIIKGLNHQIKEWQDDRQDLKIDRYKEVLAGKKSQEAELKEDESSSFFWGALQRGKDAIADTAVNLGVVKVDFSHPAVKEVDEKIDKEIKELKKEIKKEIKSSHDEVKALIDRLNPSFRSEIDELIKKLNLSDEQNAELNKMPLKNLIDALVDLVSLKIEQKEALKADFKRLEDEIVASKTKCMEFVQQREVFLEKDKDLKLEFEKVYSAFINASKTVKAFKDVIGLAAQANPGDDPISDSYSHQVEDLQSAVIEKKEIEADIVLTQKKLQDLMS